MIERAERYLDARKADETFEDAIARANEWIASVLASTESQAIHAEWAKNFDGVEATPPVAVKVVGPPAHIGEIVMLEAWLRKKLPPSYRRFLQTVGQVAFLHRPRHPTYPIGGIRSVTEGYREMMDEWFEGYDEEGLG